MIDAQHHEHKRALVAVLSRICAGFGATWKARAHHPDDPPIREGYFIVGIELPAGVIAYHYRLEHWEDFVMIEEVEHAPKWDGATPVDMAARLLELARA